MNIKEIAEESDLTSDSKMHLFNKSSEMVSFSHETTTDPFAQYPQECFDVGRSGSAVGNKQIFFPSLLPSRFFYPDYYRNLIDFFVKEVNLSLLEYSVYLQSDAAF